MTGPIKLLARDASAPTVSQGAELPAAPRTPPIHLSIVGEDLVLAGRFDHWMPVATEQGEGSEGAAQLFFDVTGLAAPRVPEGDDLFSFHAARLERVAPIAISAKGTLRHGDQEAPADALIQTPAAHTPFVVVTFSFDRDRLPAVWARLEALVAAGVDGAQMHPRAWLRPPTLASA